MIEKIISLSYTKIYKYPNGGLRMKQQKMKLLSFSLSLCLAGGVICVPSYATVSPNNKGGVVEHIQSFEDKVPDNWKVLTGELEVSGKHYKHNKILLNGIGKKEIS